MKKISFIIFTVALLSACGGGSSEKKTTPVIPPEPVNRAPVAVADAAIAQNNQAVVIDVLANDSDPENSALSITQITVLPSAGSVEIVNDTLVYTPNFNVALVDVFTYEISDGELVSTANVEIAVNHTVNISGKVTDSPIANAVVTGKLGEETFTTVADNEGNYTITVTISSMDAELLTLSAQGNENNNQTDVELVAVIDDTLSLLERINEDRSIEVIDNSTNITHVTTAAFLLTTDHNENNAITTIARYRSLESKLDIDALMATAGFIKLLIDNDDFAIPANETTMTLLQKTNSGITNTEGAINRYLEINNLIDEFGEPLASYITALSAAIDETLSDENISEQFNAEMFTNKTIIALPATKEGWLPYSGKSMVFTDTANVSIYEDDAFSEQSATVFDWSIFEGKLRLKSDKIKSLVRDSFIYPYSNLSTNYGFEQSTIDELKAAYDSGKISELIYLEIYEYDERIDYTLVNKNPLNFHTAVNTHSYYQITLPEGGDWDNTTAKSKTISNQSFATLVHSHDNPWINQSLSAVSGSWLLYFDGEFNDFLNDLKPTTAIIAKIADIDSTTSTAQVDGKAYNVNLSNGVLIFTNDNESYNYRPIQTSENAYLAIVEKRVEGKLVFTNAKQIAKLKVEAHETFKSSLVTELPKVQLTYFNGSSSESWQGDKFKFYNVYGYHFAENGVLRRGIQGVSSEKNYFYLGDDRWIWNDDNQKVNLILDTSFNKRHRTWQVISVDDEGYALVLEQSTYGYDADQSGLVEDDEIGQFIRPRVNIFKQADLSSWPEAWQNTLDLGFANQPMQSNDKARLINKIETR